MNKPSKKLLDLTIDITGERELEEFPKLLKLYTYALDMEVEIERLNNIINEFERLLQQDLENEKDTYWTNITIEDYIQFMHNKLQELKGDGSNEI